MNVSYMNKYNLNTVQKAEYKHFHIDLGIFTNWENQILFLFYMYIFKNLFIFYYVFFFKL